MGPRELAGRWEQAGRMLRENGVTYNVHGDPEGNDRPWELDALPLLLPCGEWANISAALVRVDGSDQDATVVIGITDNSTDPVNGIYQWEEWVNLVREEGEWRIVQPSWPYYDQVCEEAP